MIYQKGHLKEQCLLSFDEKAKIECEATKRALKKQNISVDIIESEIDTFTGNSSEKKETNKILSFFKK